MSPDDPRAQMLLAAAAAAGLDAEGLRVLGDTNNFVAHLPRAGLVGKAACNEENGAGGQSSTG